MIKQKITFSFMHFVLPLCGSIIEKDLRYERKSKYRLWVAFLVLVAINIAMLIFDLLHPYVGYIRYQRQMAAYTGETAYVALCAVMGKIRAATRI